MTIKGLRLPILGQPNPNEPKDVHLVGRYALGVTWGTITRASIRSIGCASTTLPAGTSRAPR